MLLPQLGLWAFWQFKGDSATNHHVCQLKTDQGPRSSCLWYVREACPEGDMVAWRKVCHMSAQSGWWSWRGSHLTTKAHSLKMHFNKSNLAVRLSVDWEHCQSVIELFSVALNSYWTCYVVWYSKMISVSLNHYMKEGQDFILWIQNPVKIKGWGTLFKFYDSSRNVLR